uniref:Uncharacterized protein n=1 Tax=Anguilla anguilla TaxID=7936 RepID=A0A0E9WJ31_ANGAN
MEKRVVWERGREVLILRQVNVHAASVFSDIASLWVDSISLWLPLVHFIQKKQCRRFLS